MLPIPTPFYNKNRVGYVSYIRMKNKIIRKVSFEIRGKQIAMYVEIHNRTFGFSRLPFIDDLFRLRKYFNVQVDQISISCGKDDYYRTYISPDGKTFQA